MYYMQEKQWKKIYYANLLVDISVVGINYK